MLGLSVKIFLLLSFKCIKGKVTTVSNHHTTSAYTGQKDYASFLA
jgi:hypothetical protein